MNRITKRTTGCAGFTVVEAVVVLGILALGMIVLGSVFVWQSSLYAEESARLNVQEAQNAALEALARDIRTGRAIASTHDSYTTGASTLIIETPLAGDETDEVNFDYIIYHASGAELIRTVDAHAESGRVSNERVIDALLQTIAFSYDKNPPLTETVTALLTSAEAVRGKTVTISDTVRIQLRNN